MRNYIAVVFKNQSKADEGLRALWDLDARADITVHGTTIVHRDWLGHFHIQGEESYPGLATALGVGIGALLGALAGPAGAAVGAGGGAAIGAGVGGAGGLLVDTERAVTHEEAREETRLVVGDGEYAVIADVSEAWTSAIDSRMKQLGGLIYRRARSAVSDDAWFGPYPYYPYDYYLWPDPYYYGRP
jgi:uncharacterized membrane protein